jgi:polyisoprenoid-binding protein YceI
MVVPLLLCAGLAAAQSADQQRYVIDPESSEVYWLVSAAGAFARLGHNHVISVEEMSGTIDLVPADLQRSTFSIEIPVADLVVDDPELRARLGERFASVPSAEDIAGTRQNMLGDRVLNGAMFPTLRIDGRGPRGNAADAELPVRIAILGRTVDLSLPGEVEVGDDYVEAVGSFSLNHADLGMMPFSVMMGALQVGEQIDFSYRIRAKRAAHAAH